MSAADPVSINLNNFDDFEQQLEEIFDKADYWMIQMKQFDKAVSFIQKFNRFVSLAQTLSINSRDGP
jgi:hypothetical protein